MSKRGVVTTLFGLLPLSLYALSYVIDGELIGKCIVLGLFGVLLAAAVYTCPLWEED
jgi:hypothetical protein